MRARSLSLLRPSNCKLTEFEIARERVDALIVFVAVDSIIATSFQVRFSLGTDSNSQRATAPKAPKGPQRERRITQPFGHFRRPTSLSTSERARGQSSPTFTFALSLSFRCERVASDALTFSSQTQRSKASQLKGPPRERGNPFGRMHAIGQSDPIGSGRIRASAR